MPYFRGFPYVSYYVVLVLVWGFTWLIYTRMRSRLSADIPINHFTFLSLLGFSFLGLTVGILAGRSRNPVVDVVISSVLTFYGGIVIYLFTKSDRENQILSASSLIVMSFALLFGTYLGASDRLEAEKQWKEFEQWYSKDLIEYRTDMEIYAYRQKKLIDQQFKETGADLEKKAD